MITHKSLTNHALQRIGTHTYANFFSLIFSDFQVLQARNMHHMSANRHWKVVDERDSGKHFRERSLIFHAYFAHCPRKNCANYAKTTQNRTILRKRLLREAELWAAQNLESRKAPIWRISVDNYGGSTSEKTDEMRKSLMYRVRLEFCTWFMYLRVFWAVYPRL